jgi:hypothetical protein
MLLTRRRSVAQCFILFLVRTRKHVEGYWCCLHGHSLAFWLQKEMNCRVYSKSGVNFQVALTLNRAKRNRVNRDPLFYSFTQYIYSALHYLLLLLFFFWLCSTAWAMASSSTRFLDRTQRRVTVDRTPLDEWSALRRDLYMTTHTTDKHPSPRWDSNPRSQHASGRRPTP